MTLFKTVLFWVLVPGTVVGLIPYLLLIYGPAIPVDGLGGVRYFGIIPLAGGFLFYIASARNFVEQGKGTPSPDDPPKHLVISGPYHFVRNPMYVGGVLILLGESILCESVFLLVYLFFIWLAFHSFIVFYEEPHLRKVFGREYEEYRKKVRRWLPDLKRVFREIRR